MSQHELLQTRVEQHKAKNIKSKKEDKNILCAANKVIDYLTARFNMEENYPNYHLEFKKNIKLSDMISFIEKRGVRTGIYNLYGDDRTIAPDGGIIYLVDEKQDIKYPLVISETKHQGTNKERMKKGKKKQAQGNAIERLGKNITAIKTYLHYENITPFVCFGQGSDFGEGEDYILSKVWVLNEFYDLNKINVNKRDNDKEHGGYAPVSMFFREKEWSVDELFEIMKEIAEYSFRYWLF